jgi:hypothetical protein
MTPPKLIGIMPARNEEWIIGLSARVALLWCDELVVLDHASTDDTPGILAELAGEYPGRVTVIHEPDPGWPEMEHRQRLLEAARAREATHVAIVDADEIMTATLVNRIKQMVFSIARTARIMCVPMYCMWRGTDAYRQDRSVWSNRFLTLAFADHPMLHWAAKNGYQWHQREPKGSLLLPPVKRSLGGVMHMQFADWRRLKAKHALYKMREALAGKQPIPRIERMYSLALDETAINLAEAPREWWVGYDPWMKHYRPDQEPWQEQECLELWSQHGAAVFKGLNLFGVVKKEVAA